MKYSVMIIFTLLFNLSKGKESTKAKLRIANGEFALKEHFPYMAALWYNNNFHCSASIVTTRWVLTAAHCLENIPSINALRLTVGSTSIYDGQEHTIKKFYTHPKYDGLQFDIGMVKAKDKFTLDGLASKIILDNLRHTGGSYRNCIVPGWGKIFQNEQSFWPQDGRLRFNNVSVISTKACEKLWKQWFKNYHICAIGDGDGSGPCDGDSGSPLVCEGVQVGIVSYARADCGSDKWYAAGAVYTRISNFSSWIRKTAKL